MKELIAARVPNVFDGLGFAADNGSEEMLRLLMETTGSYDYRQQAVGGILHWAAYTWSSKNAKYLTQELEYEKVALDAEKQSALGAALLAVFAQESMYYICSCVVTKENRSQMLKIIEILVDAGASVIDQDEGLATPLHWVLQREHLHLGLLDYLLIAEQRSTYLVI
jgi:hypothetical protein